MTDQGFPIVTYAPGATPREWGRRHGEAYRQGIRELYEIRLGLLREKNVTLTNEAISRLAAEQWAITTDFDRELTEELEGIAEGARLTPHELVVLNNYTDFRDIHLSDQGCSMVFVRRQAGPIAGQTWDMHGSAKNYVCCLDIPGRHAGERSIVFSLVGCVGLMGYTSRGTMVGVNNINTDGAQPGILWPVLVRKALQAPHLEDMRKILVSANVTSGHNYLLADRTTAEMWEVMPGLSECVGSLVADERGALIHTNHCLGHSSRLREIPAAVTSTTHIRYDLLQKKIDHIQSLDDVHALLNDHENYPQSICSNFQTSTQDPSITCGGAVGHLETGEIRMWRGDAMYDSNFREHRW